MGDFAAMHLINHQYLPCNLLQWNKTRRVGSTDTRPSVFDRFAISQSQPRLNVMIDRVNTHYEILNSPK